MLILHGDNQTASRQHFLAAKQGRPVITFSGSDLSLDRLVQAARSRSLFNSADTVVIESLFSLRPDAQRLELVNYLRSFPDSEIIIWEPKDVTARLRGFPPSVIKKYDLPKHIFKFLDTLAVADLRQTLTVAAPEIVFASLVTRLRKRIIAGDAKTIPAYLSLLDLDYNQKTSHSPYSLSAALELWCIKLNNTCQCPSFSALPASAVTVKTSLPTGSASTSVGPLPPF